MFSYWAYVLIGQNNTGKTSFQRHLVSHLCGRRYSRLQTNLVEQINHPRAPKSLETLFTCNRSFQELRSRYKTVDNYFRKFFKNANICMLSSHTSGTSARDIEAMISNLKRRCYNVSGVFWSNSFNRDAQGIALLPWTELLHIENPHLKDASKIDAQIEKIAVHFSEFLLARANLQ